jgi:folylpolyglutamate synthase/dihydropteroate synthase
LTDAAVREAAQVYIPGRMEAVQYDGRTVILDVAHNAQKLHALAESIRRKYPGQKVAVVVSLVRSKDYRLESSAEELVPLVDHVIITGFSSPDFPQSSTSDDNLAKVFTGQGARSVEVIGDPEAALRALLQRPEPVLLVTGSFFLLSQIRPLLRR